MPALLASVLMLSTEVAERMWMTASDSDVELREAVERLSQVPHAIGRWIGRDLPLDATQRVAASVAGGLVREYTHRDSGQSLTITLLVGPVSAIAAHPPTACFRGQGHQILGEPHALVVSDEGVRHTFRSARFVAPGTSPYVTHVAWSWCADQPGSVWNAPRFPRWTFAGRHSLKKLYVTCVSEADRGEGANAPSPYQEKEVQEFLERITETTSRL